MRSERSHLQFLGFLAVGTTVIASSSAAWPVAQVSIRDLLQPAILAWAVVSVLSLLLLAWIARLTFVLVRAWRTIRDLPATERMPARLAASIARTGARRVLCISSGLPIAFCAGVVRPSIIVSEGLADELDDLELDAVLLHEHHHAREREPFARAAWEAAAQVLFLCPTVRWWSQERIVEAELRADQAAVRRVGPQPVAAALCRLGATMPAAAAFAGGAELRVGQLLGDPLPARRPGAWTVASSMLGLPFAVTVAACLVLELAKIAVA